MAKSFVLNDESIINDRGFILLNAGIDRTRFEANPVMLNQHDPQQVIGRWENVRVEGTKLLADPVFDEVDDEAKKVQGKVERGFLRGGSPWIVPLEAELKEVPVMGLVPIVTKSELMEASVVSVPSNALSLRLSSRDGKILETNADIKLAIDSIMTNNIIPKKMEKITLSAEAAVALGLGNDATSEVISAAIVKLSAKAADALRDKKTAEDALAGHMKLQAETLVDTAIQEGRLTADKKDSFVKLATSDFKQAKDLIDAMPPKQTLSGKIQPPKAGEESREGWDYMKWAKEDPKGLQLMSTQDPDAFEKLKSGYKSKR